MKQADRAIDWARDDTQTVLRKIHAADGFPGVRDDACCGREVHLFGAHEEGTVRAEPSPCAVPSPRATARSCARPRTARSGSRT